MFQISKKHQFSASHILSGLREGHPCGRLHGHNYEIELVLQGEEVGAEGFLVDYGDLRPFFAWIDDELDHRHLNDVIPSQPSAENLSRLLNLMAREVLTLPEDIDIIVRVSETSKTSAEWRAS